MPQRRASPQRIFKITASTDIGREETSIISSPTGQDRHLPTMADCGRLAARQFLTAMLSAACLAALGCSPNTEQRADQERNASEVRNSIQRNDFGGAPSRVETARGDREPCDRILRTSVSSSALSTVGYCIKGRILEIEFVHGSVYRYYGVPPSVYHGLMNASSHGQYFNNSIRPAGYRYERVG